MNPKDVKALNSAIRELTKTLKDGGGSNPTSPGDRSDSLPAGGEITPDSVIKKIKKAQSLIDQHYTPNAVGKKWEQVYEIVKRNDI